MPLSLVRSIYYMDDYRKSDSKQNTPEKILYGKKMTV